MRWHQLFILLTTKNANEAGLSISVTIRRRGSISHLTTSLTCRLQYHLKSHDIRRLVDTRACLQGTLLYSKMLYSRVRVSDERAFTTTSQRDYVGATRDLFLVT
jgi:hypothetical protein